MVGPARDAQQAHMPVAAHHHDVFDEHREVPVDLLVLRHVGDEIVPQRFGRGQAEDLDPAAAPPVRSP